MLPSLHQVETVSELLQTAHINGCAARRTDCLNFLVDNAEQVQKTAGFKRLVEEEPTIMMDFMGLIAPRLKKLKTGGG